MWGGGSTTGPTKGGYECSGLMLYAFYQGARVTLPRTSQQMRRSGTRVPRSQIRPGDLIVINNDGNWGHVGCPSPRSVGSVIAGEVEVHGNRQADVRRRVP
ncbi:NlpC/P60 family protein [Streptomyces sp. NPDC053720]|uniref:C40 family peptidase n=1 Tax=Streptomyces sp. NPDC053720 TaxID=3154855 RepID=UPI003418AB5A